MAKVELEENERFIDVCRDEYGVLTFRILMRSGKVFPTHKLTEHVLCKNSRKRLRDAYTEISRQDPTMGDL